MTNSLIPQHWGWRDTWRRITRAEFYALGGFMHPCLVRRGISGGWAYYYVERR